MRILSGVLTLLLTIGACAQSMEETFKLIKFRPPEGWTTTGSDPIRQYMHSQGNAFCVITINLSSSAAGSDLSDFQEEWNMRVLSVGSALENVTPSTGTLPSGLHLVQGGSDIILNNGSNIYAHLLVIRVGTMRQSVLLGMTNKSMLTHYQKELDQFLTSIKEAQSMDVSKEIEKNAITSYDKDIPMVASNKGTFYHGIETVFIGPGAGNNPKYLYLFPDNTFQWGYYQRGYYNYNRTKEQQSNPNFCGTYTKSGNTIRLNFLDKSGYAPEFTIDEKGNLKDRSSSYTLHKFHNMNGLSLQGTYTIKDIDPDTWGGSKPKATFRLDGTFEDSGLLCMGERIDESIPLDQANRRMNENKAPGKGSYRITDHSLILAYNDGRKRQLLIYIYDKDKGKSSPDVLHVASMPLVLAK